MMNVRRLNNEGVADFENFIQQLRSGIELNIPYHLLSSHEYSSDIDLDISLDEGKVFDSRYQIGEYLVTIFKSHDIRKHIGDIGFWSWFGLLWFDQLCPKKNGKRVPSKGYNYVLSYSYNHRPRHAIYMTWQLVDRYGEDARFMLCKEPSTRGEITEQMMARQEILSSEGAMQLASELYFEKSSKNFKKGAAARKSAGCVSRYISWLQQLQLTFDIYSISREELAALLPSEFDRFRETADSV